MSVIKLDNQKIQDVLQSELLWIELIDAMGGETIVLPPNVEELNNILNQK